MKKKNGQENELENYTKSTKSTLLSPSLSELTKYENGVEVYGVEGITVSLEPNSMCWNVLQIILQPIESQTLDSKLIIHFQSRFERKNSQIKSFYVSVANFP